MTATAPTTATPTNATRTLATGRPLSLARAIHVELRKLVDTRAGMALLATGVLLTGAFAGGRALLGGGPTTLGQLANLAAWPAGLVVMVMAILLVTGEFSQRTASITFVLDPRRGRVLAAKALAVLGVAVLAGILALAAALGAALVAQAFGSPAVSLAVSAGDIAVLVGSTVFTAATGFAWALATRNAPAPIVVLLVWPTVSLLLGSLSDALATALSWIELQPVATLALGVEHGWWKLLVATVVWIIVPAAIGTIRTLRRDLP